MVLKPTTRTPAQIETLVKVELMGSHLKLGETIRGVCPRCSGGSTGEKSFRITRDLGSVCRFVCFRASCGYYGNTTLAFNHRDNTTAPTRVRQEFRGALESLRDDDVQMFRRVFGINPDRDTYWCSERDRYAHKVLGPLSEHRGWVLRDYSGSHTPKSLAYPSPGLTGPFIAWYYPNENVNDDVVVVEDLLSAKKISDSGFIGVALLGTYLSLEAAYEIAHHLGKGTLHLALDEGTTDIMVRYKEKFSVVFGDVKVWSLLKDLKYVERERIRKAVEHGAINFRIDDAGEGRV